MRYTICVDGKYFVGETMERLEGTAIATSGFFQMVPSGNYLTAYEFSEDVSKADKIPLFDAIGYLEGINARTRYLPDDQKPKHIEIAAADAGKGE